MTRHDRLVRSMAAALWLGGFEVRADLAGWPRPARMQHFVPDIMATSGGSHRRRIIAEVEEENSLFNRHSMRQILFLASAASPSTICYLIVPRNCLPLAALLIAQLGVKGLVRLGWVSPWVGGCYATASR